MRCPAFFVAPLAAFAAAAGAQPFPTWSFDPAASTFNATAAAFADNGDNGLAPGGPFFTSTLTAGGFNPAFGPYDFGNAANPFGDDPRRPLLLHLELRPRRGLR